MVLLFVRQRRKSLANTLATPPLQQHPCNNTPATLYNTPTTPLQQTTFQCYTGRQCKERYDGKRYQQVGKPRRDQEEQTKRRRLPGNVICCFYRRIVHVSHTVHVVRVVRGVRCTWCALYVVRTTATVTKSRST